jgi:hypothetical protein
VTSDQLKERDESGSHEAMKEESKIISWFPGFLIRLFFFTTKKPCAGKRMAEKSYFGPRSLRRNYPHQVQGVRPGRLSRVGSPALGVTLE